MNSTVDILLASRNGQAYISEQIESILKQTYRDFHLTVYDDNSSDGTFELVERMAESDTRITVKKRMGRIRGAKYNFFDLLRDSNADYIAFSDQDDIWDEDKLELSIAQMLAAEEEYGKKCPLMVFSDTRVVNEDLSMICESFFEYSNIDPNRNELKDIAVQAVVPGCTMLINRALREMFNREFDEKRVAMHDWWLSLIASAFGHISFINNSTSSYRQHGHNTLGADEYSVMSRMARMNEMIERVRIAGEQAKQFRITYEYELDTKQITCLRHIESSVFGARLFRIPHMIRSGAYKQGLPRIIGQCISLLIMSSDRNRLNAKNRGVS